MHSGWRPRAPELRGVSYVASEPEVDLGSEDLGWVPYIALLPFFHVAYPGRGTASTSSKPGSSALVSSESYPATSPVSGDAGSDLAAPLAGGVQATVVECKVPSMSPLDHLRKFRSFVHGRNIGGFTCLSARQTCLQLQRDI